MKKALLTLSLMTLVLGFGLQANAQETAVRDRMEAEPAQTVQTAPWGRYVAIVHPNQSGTIGHEIAHLDAGHVDPDTENTDGNYVRGYVTVDNVDEEEGYEDEFAAEDEDSEVVCGNCDENGIQACHDGEKFYFRACDFR